MSSLTKLELQDIHAHLGALLPPGRALRVEEIVRVGELRDRLARVIAELRPVEEKGDLVLSWAVSRDLAPTMNAYAFLKGWQKTKMRTRLDTELRAHVDFRDAELNAAKKRRWVRVTRFSTQQPDELSVDVLGGKMPVDALVRCGVLYEDSPDAIVREGRWEKCKRGETSVLIDVFEVTTEGQPVAELQLGVVPQPQPMQLGAFTRAVIDGRQSLENIIAMGGKVPTAAGGV